MAPPPLLFVLFLFRLFSTGGILLVTQVRGYSDHCAHLLPSGDDVCLV